MTDTHIKINAVVPKVQYTGNGSTTVFPYEFAIFDETDMNVYLGDEIQETGYTVSGAGETEGGNVTFDTAPEDGVKITLIRNIPIERITDFQEGGTFRPKNLNDEFDRQTAFLQQVQETLDRSVKVGPTSDITPEVVLAQVERVYDSIDNIDAVADDLTNVDTVAADTTNIDTVAGSIGNVNAVGGSISNVNTVAGISSNVTTVAGISSAVSNVSSIKDDVSTVSGISSSVSSVASNATNINTVASDISDVVAVGSNIAKVTAVADNETNINAVNANKTNIDTVAGVSSNVTTVAGIASDVATVSGISSNVTAVANNATNINAVNANKTNIDSVANNISNVNAVGSNISNVNTVAGDSANIATVVNNITAINAAPTYAAQAKQWAIGEPSEPANGSAKYWAERAHVYTEGVLHEDLISNCITEIPQDINLTLSNGALTLKSGSVITRPDGSQYQTTQEQGSGISVGSGSWVGYIIPYNTSGILQEVYKYVTSGSSFPQNPATHAIHYDTTNNKIYMYSTNAQTWNETNMCLPIAKVTVTSGVITSIDQVFNGAGYIGHHAFVFPGVSALGQNGINIDGTLKTYPFSINSLFFMEMATFSGSDDNTRAVGIWQNNVSSCIESKKEFDYLPENPEAYVDYYIKSMNKIMVWDGSSWGQRTRMPFVYYTYKNNSVTNFEIKQPVRLATTEMTDALQSQIDTKADKSLSNLDSAGQMVIDSQNGTISNCILDIPQDIKLELNNGTLTLKAGSIITRPDGTQLQMAADKTVSITTNNKYFIYPASNGGFITSARIDKTNSGTTDSMVGVSYHVWYDTINNVINRYGSDGTTLESTVCLPVCIITVSNGAISSIDQVFNGAGYIGHHTFVLPGVKTLVPDGLNDDGTMKSVAISTSSLIIQEMSQLRSDYTFTTAGTVDIWNFVETNDPSSLTSYQMIYMKDENNTYGNVGSGSRIYKRCYFLTAKYNGTTVTDFTIRKPIRLATTEMTNALDNNIQNFQNRFQVVANLPATPEVGVFYFISEE